MEPSVSSLATGLLQGRKLGQFTKQDRIEAAPPEAGGTYWEQVSQSRWGNYITTVESRVLLKALHLAGRATDALEVGCDGGRWSRMLAERRWRVTCTDVNEKTLAICRQRLPEAECILVDPSDTTLPFADAAARLVLCIEVLPIISSDWFLREANRVLEPEGLVMGVFFNPISLRAIGYRMAKRLSRKPCYSYYRGSSYSEFRRELDANGFDLLHEEGICWFPFSRSSNSPLIPAFTKLEEALGLRALTALSPWVVFIARKRSDSE